MSCHCVSLAGLAIGSAQGAVKTSSEHAGVTLADGEPFVTWVKFNCGCVRHVTMRFSVGSVKAMAYHDHPDCKDKATFKPKHGQKGAEAAVAEVQVDKGDGAGSVWIKAKELKVACGYHRKDNPSANILPLGWRGAQGPVRKVAVGRNV